MFGNLGDSLTGAWLIMRGRAEGLTRLDLSLEGFWRSFAAIALILPFAVLGLMSQRALGVGEDGGEPAPPTGDGLGWQAAALLGDWIAFPLVFAALARPLGLGARYVPFIVARNWATVVITAAVSLVHAGHIVGLLPSGLASFLLFAAVAVALHFSYMVVRTTLAVPMTVALPIVALDFLISLTIWSAFDRFG